MSGETLTVRGNKATLTRPKDWGADFTGPVTRSGSNFTIRVSEPEDQTPFAPRSLRLDGTVRPNALLTGQASFGGPIGNGGSGFDCDYTFEAWGPRLAGPSCSIASIRKTPPPAGAAWDTSPPPQCTGVWAVAALRSTDPRYLDGPPDMAVLKWNGSRWTPVPNQCGTALKGTIPAEIWHAACTQD